MHAYYYHYIVVLHGIVLHYVVLCWNIVVCLFVCLFFGIIRSSIQKELKNEKTDDILMTSILPRKKWWWNEYDLFVLIEDESSEQFQMCRSMVIYYYYYYCCYTYLFSLNHRISVSHNICVVLNCKMIRWPLDFLSHFWVN
jgi:hypothetical protein